MAELRTPRCYEMFVQEGIKDAYRAEWHPGEQAPFLGPERFINKIPGERMPPPTSRRASLGDLLTKFAREAGLEPRPLRRKGRTAAVVATRDRFICYAVMEEGYLASEVAQFLGCHPPT